MALFRKIFWLINSIGISFVAKGKYNLQLSPKAAPLPEGPFLMISNHATFFDPWMVGHLSKHPISIMMNEFGFKAPAMTRWYLKNIGCFKKHKGKSDHVSVKKMLKSLRAGYPVLVFPEGQASWSGETQRIYPGLVRIAKKVGVPIVINRLRGNFLTSPWWSTGEKRNGRIHLDRSVISADEVRTRDEAELEEMVRSGIYNNDIKACAAEGIEFTGQNIALGLENVLWYCPSCGESDTIRVEKEYCWCSHCSVVYNFDANLRIAASEPQKDVADFYDWYILQEEKARENIQNCTRTDTPLFREEHTAQIRVDYSGRIIMLDTGRMELYSDRLVFVGQDGEQTFQLKNIESPVFQGKNILEFTCCRSEYEFQIPRGVLQKWLSHVQFAAAAEGTKHRK
ncbi:MAG: lysophospholipid acyltransferase family protein [Fibrobacterota bacterium]